MKSRPASFVRIRSEASDPIQLSDVRPVACESLARLGSQNDGGYVVPLEAVKRADALLSFGLSHDWTFEQDFAAYNPKAAIHCYDHTVSWLTSLRYAPGQLLRYLLRFEPIYLRRALRFVDYPIFFRGNRIHFKKRLWHNCDEGSATVDIALGSLKPDAQVFVKIDIEGSEYQVLDDLLRHAARIVALVIEFHEVDVAPERFNSFLGKIKRDFHIVHIHGNNMGGVAPFNFPAAPEISFLNKRFFAIAPQPSGREYPVEDLDRPNHPGLPEFKFEF